MMRVSRLSPVRVAACLFGAATLVAAPQMAMAQDDGREPAAANPPKQVKRPPPIYSAPPPPPAPNLARSAVPRNQARWARRFRYEPAVAFLGEEGTTGVAVTVMAHGRISKCTVTASSGFAGLDERTCRLMTRYARFNPALDDKGNPTIGAFSTRIVWRVLSDEEWSHSYLGWDSPKDAGELSADRLVSVRFYVDASGKTSDCQVIKSSGVMALDQATCREISKMKGSREIAPKESKRSVKRVVVWKGNSE